MGLSFTDAVNQTSPIAFPGAMIHDAVAINIATNQNNLSPVGIGTVNLIDIQARSAGLSISGLAGGIAYREITLLLSGANPISLLEENAGSIAVNRFFNNGLGPVNFTSCVTFIWNPRRLRWQFKPVNAVGEG